MNAAGWERSARGMGVVFAALALIAFITYGEGPKLEDSADDVASFYSDNGGRVLTALTIFSLSLIPLLWFAGAIANELRRSGEGRLAATVIATLAAWAATQLVFVATAAPLAVSLAESADPEISQALNGLGLAIDNVSAFPLAGGIAAASVGLARSRVLPGWFMWFGLAVAALVVLHGTNWASEGFWSPGGGYLFVVVASGLLWAVVTSVLLFRAPILEETSAAAAAGPP